LICFGRKTQIMLTLYFCQNIVAS